MRSRLHGCVSDWPAWCNEEGMASSLVEENSTANDLTPRPGIYAAAWNLPLVGARIVSGIGLVVLIIGFLRPAAFAYEHLSFPLMVPATAVGLMLAGCSFMLLARDRRTANRTTLAIARSMAVLCAAIGGVTLAARIAADWSAAIDDLPAPGFWGLRPAPNTAFNLMLLGLALYALSSRREGVRRMARRQSAMVLVVSLLALVGHGYGASMLYGSNGVRGMTVSTALAFTVLALGVLFYDLERGIASIFVSESPGGRLLRRLGPAAIAVPPLLGWIRLNAEAIGLVDDAFGLSIFVVTLVVVFQWLLVRQAAALHFFDIDRSRLHGAERAARAEAEAARHAAERARRDADEANQAKSLFLATMSHEIRTPINAIVGYSQLIELGVAGPVTAQQREYLGRLGATSEHLRGVVDDVLDLAKIDAGGMTVARDVSLTGSLVTSALDLVRPQASAKEVRIADLTAGATDEPFIGDEHRVRQILVNLLSNAIKFTESGGAITIDARQLHAPPPSSDLHGNGPWTAVSVTDTGIGIAADQHAFVFAPFHQAERGNTRKQGGTGLGLTISRRLARLMAGDLTLESTLGVGSTFTLLLPAASPHDRAISPPAVGVHVRPVAASSRVHGLAEVGMGLRERVEEVLASYAARIRTDAALPGAADLRRSEIEDHQLSFLADIAQTLVVVEETGGVDSDLLRDGSTIQRVVAELHGAMRQRRGWNEAQLDREYVILDDEIAAVVRRRVPEGMGDVTLALDVLHRLVERAHGIGVNALRRAAEAKDRVAEGA